MDGLCVGPLWHTPLFASAVGPVPVQVGHNRKHKANDYNKQTFSGPAKGAFQDDRH